VSVSEQSERPSVHRKVVAQQHGARLWFVSEIC